MAIRNPAKTEGSNSRLDWRGRFLVTLHSLEAAACRMLELGYHHCGSLLGTVPGISVKLSRLKLVESTFSFLKN